MWEILDHTKIVCTPNNINQNAWPRELVCEENSDTMQSNHTLFGFPFLFLKNVKIINIKNLIWLDNEYLEHPAASFP